MRTLSLVLMSALILTAGCGKKKQGGWGEMVVPVVAAPAVEQSVEETIRAVGTLTGEEYVDIKSETDGAVRVIHFDEGQYVKKDEVLVELDQEKLRAALAQAQADLKLAASTTERYAALLQSQAVAQQEADQAQATWSSTKALVDRLTAELDDATIKAPFAGITGAKLLSVGQFIPRGTSITTLIDTDPMKLEFRIPERFIGQIKSQQAVKLTTAAYPDAPFTGEVYFIDPQIDAATRSVLLKARVPNKDSRLRHGMFADVELIVQVRPQAVVIPETAILYQGELAFVYAIDAEQKAQMRPVKIGVRLPNLAEIVEGVASGEQVVVEGHQKLFPGVKVMPKPLEAPPAAPKAPAK